ncbi:IclR family transcriptional regulator [Egicoccus sp. AB-alg2]|uniref:IclR family transcriptional regulator n=1 Tax=Egicoccus sp. AB-alg2 TaxID=3242693 RepID=UPI00359DD6EA
MEPPSDLIQSVSRALRILEAVGASPGGCNPKVVARRCDLHLSTTYHLLRTLAYEGYLARTSEGDYRLGLEISDRFRDLQASLTRPPRVAAVLRHLADTTGHSAYLARFVDDRVAIAGVVEAAGSPHLEDLIPGFDEAPHATALGKALLSRLPSRRRHDLVRGAGMRPFTSRTIRDLAALDAELAGTDVDTVFVEHGQFRGGVSCAAMLVPTADPEDPWWAIAVSAASPTFAGRRERLAAGLRVAAGDLAA